jgi:hypothetical protein
VLLYNDNSILQIMNDSGSCLAARYGIQIVLQPELFGTDSCQLWSACIEFIGCDLALLTAGAAGCSVGSRPQEPPAAVHVQCSTNTPADIHCWAAASTAATTAGVQVRGRNLYGAS